MTFHILNSIISHTYLSDIYGHLAKWKGSVELKKFLQQML